MTATNHALTGTALGLLIAQPAIALPLALASHYILDMVPHFKLETDDTKLVKNHWFKDYLAVDGLLLCLILLGLFLIRPDHWQLALACAVLAFAPDLAWLNKFWDIKHKRIWQASAYGRLADRIQWFEKPIGLVVEVVWLVAVLILIAPFIHR